MKRNVRILSCSRRSWRTPPRKRRASSRARQTRSWRTSRWTAPTSPELVERAKAGDQAAFTELYERTSAMVYRTIRSMVRDEDLVWDVQQNMYLRAWRKLGELWTPGAFLPWLRRIAVNETARAMEKRLPLCLTELGGEEDESEQDVPDLRPAVQPELALDRKETARLVRELLASLPEQQQLILGMRYYEEMPVKDIAALLQVSTGTVKTQLSRGRKRVEAGVRALEQQGVRLCGMAPLPFLLALPQTPGFNALVSRERLVALPHLLYHTSI